MSGEVVLTLDLLGPSGDVVEVREKFLLGPVQQPILCLGKFFQNGWSLNQTATSQLALSKEDIAIDAHYKQNSLQACAFVRALTSDDIPVTLLSEFSGVQRREGWHCFESEEFWFPVHFSKNSVRFKSGLPAYIPDAWHTLLYIEGKWLIVEGNQLYVEEVMPYGRHGRTGCPMITILHQGALPWHLFFRSPSECPERFRFLRPRVQQTKSQAESMQVDQTGNEDQSSSPDNVREEPRLEHKETRECEIQASPNIEAVPRDPVVEYAPPSKIKVGGVELTEEGTLKVMREACEFLQIGKTGSKAKCWKRLTTHLHEFESKMAADVIGPPCAFSSDSGQSTE